MGLISRVSSRTYRDMASRYWRYGTLYARTCDAIKLNILTPKQRPVWLEAYAMYPPLDNPVWNAEEDLVTDITFQPKKLDDLTIVYPEDEITGEVVVVKKGAFRYPKPKMTNAAEEAMALARRNGGARLSSKEVQSILHKHQPDYSRALTSFVQALDKEHTGQPDPVGRLFGRQHGDELRGWPMY